MKTRTVERLNHAVANRREYPDQSRLTLLAVCAALLFGLWAIQVHPYLNPADDSGRYMVLGESLAKTGDLRLLNEARHPRDTLYPPGFPAMIALWIRVTGRDPGGVVLLVKATQIVLMIGMLPLLTLLLKRARLSRPALIAALLTAALCPATAAYANEVMSETPFLLLLLAAIVLLERRARLPKEGKKERPPARWKRLLALLCAAAAFLTRTAGIALLLTLIGWFWRRYGWRWGLLALLTTLVVVGGWQWRNQQIVRSHPEIHYSTYLDQFSLRDPDDPHGGRIQLNAIGLLGRARRGLPIYIGMIPRTILYTMAPPHTLWLGLFYAAAIPLTLLTLLGFMEGWRRGLYLSGVFSALFWLFAAMWPWHSARFLFPLAPFILMYLYLGIEVFANGLQRRAGLRLTRVVLAALGALLLAHFARVDYVVIPPERRPALPGYALGRNRPEGGFYAACAWLQQNAPPDTLVMGRPAYLLHLYSGHPTTQIEPTDSPRVQEKAYIVPRHVRYLVEDAWPWSHTGRYLSPYLRDYAAKWRLAWQDPLGSNVRVWERLPAPPQGML
jgi:hypothetical protein